MRYIDVLEQYRKDYKIPVTTFIEDVMSTHTYYRYLKGNTDLKVSQAVSLLKKTDIDPEALFSYLADLQDPHKHDLEKFIQHRVNGHPPRVEKAYERLMASYSVQTMYVYKKPYKKFERENLNTLYKQAMDMIVLSYQCEVGLIDQHTFETYLELSKDPYILFKKDHLYSLLITAHAYKYQKPIMPLDEMFTLATKESFFKSYAWDLMFLVFQQLTYEPKIKIYEVFKASYIPYIDYMLKKLQGTLDIGFIKSIYYHGFLRYTIDYHENKQKNYLLRYLMTSQFNDTKEQQLAHIQEIESIIGPIDSILTPYLEALKTKGAS